MDGLESGEVEGYREGVWCELLALRTALNGGPRVCIGMRGGK